MPPSAILLDIDGVLYVDDDPIPGATDALRRLRDMAGVRLLTNTTSRSHEQVLAHLRALHFAVARQELLTPAALAVRHCRQRGYRRVALLVAQAVREDLAELEGARCDEPVDAIVLGDLGDGFTPEVLNRALAQMLEGAELIALQHNRVYRRGGRLLLDVGAYAAALEYATGRDSTVVGKPEPAFFTAALADLEADPDSAVMVGDDIEADVGGALDAGLRGILVRTGKFREDLAARSGVQPTAIVDSIADVPALLAGREFRFPAGARRPPHVAGDRHGRRRVR